MKIVIDKKGPIGSDCTSRDLCHFEDPETPSLREVINLILSYCNEWGDVTIRESYDPTKDELGKYITSFEYKCGKLLNNIDSELMEKKVKLASRAGGWGCCDYHLYLAQ